MPRFLRLPTFAAALVGAALLAPAAHADPLQGAWQFKTDIQDKGCTIEGRMVIEPRLREDGVRGCRFVSSETCGEDGRPVTIEQSCRVIEQGAFVLITSTVEYAHTDGYDLANYMADHFTVKRTGPSELSGDWHDERYRDRVRFWRAKQAPST